MGQRDGVIAPRLSSRRRKLVRHVHNIGHVDQGIVERLGVMLQHVELGGLFLPFCHARNGNGISDRWYRSLSCPTLYDFTAVWVAGSTTAATPLQLLLLLQLMSGPAVSGIRHMLAG
jgi:hypothetical protein